MAHNLIISASQIATALARIAGYSLAVLKIGAVAGSSSLLLAIGYLPFLAFVDVLVQAYSRALHLHAGGVPKAILNSRQYVAIVLLVAVILMFISGWYRSTVGSASLLMVGTYLAGGLAYFWEQWTTYKRRQLWLSLLELSVISSSVLVFFFFGHQPFALMLCLISFPLARLMLLTGSGEDPLTVDRLNSPGTGVQGYVAFSLAQQLVGAMSSSLPSIISQLRGNYSGLAESLVVFRLMHSIAATASLVINAMGARLFYGTVGGGFDVFERHFVEKSDWFRVAMVMLFLCTLGIALDSHSQIFAASAPLVLILILINFESSLSMNRGLPKSSLYCQIVVLLISIALISILMRHLNYFLLFVILALIIYLRVHSTVFKAHRRRLRADFDLRV